MRLDTLILQSPNRGASVPSLLYLGEIKEVMNSGYVQTRFLIIPHTLAAMCCERLPTEAMYRSRSLQSLPLT